MVPKTLRAAFLQDISLKLSVPVGSKGKVVSYTSLREMLQFDWNIAAGDRFIDPKGLFELEGKYGRFVRYKDMFLELDEKQLESLARKMEKAPSPSPLDLLKTGLTGTFDGPTVENRLLDYWSIVDFVMKGYLGSKSGFKESYAVPIEGYRDRRALERFHSLTSPFKLRRLKTDKRSSGGSRCPIMRFTPAGGQSLSNGISFPPGNGTHRAFTPLRR